MNKELRISSGDEELSHLILDTTILFLSDSLFFILKEIRYREDHEGHAQDLSFE